MYRRGFTKSLIHFWIDAALGETATPGQKLGWRQDWLRPSTIPSLANSIPRRTTTLKFRATGGDHREIRRNGSEPGSRELLHLGNKRRHCDDTFPLVFVSFAASLSGGTD